MKKGYQFTSRTINALINGYYNHNRHCDDDGNWQGETQSLQCLKDLTKYQKAQISNWRGMGKKAMAELDEAFKEFGLSYAEMPPIESNFLPL
jgi:hypothetical protein